ncbi:MAG: hypothetical protein JWQ40_3684 [Segetibacter sp.]|nr:hypothetical protein [Segetibacter sp.]
MSKLQERHIEDNGRNLLLVKAVLLKPASKCDE